MRSIHSFCRLAMAGLVVFAGLVLRPRAGEPAAVNGPNGAKSGSPGEWKPLFDGKTLAGWKPSGFDGEGSVRAEHSFRDGAPAIVLERGTYLTGLTWTQPDALPRLDYEIAIEAMKIDGSDFFCGLTFPVGNSACSFIVGGWGGRVVGLSSVDHSDASENETAEVMDFAPDRWYRIRVRVRGASIEAWIDDRRMVNLETKDRIITTRGGDIDKARPLGISAYNTRAAVRDFRLRRL